MLCYYAGNPILDHEEVHAGDVLGEKECLAKNS